MLLLMDHCVKNKVKCTTKGEFCDLIGIELAATSEIKKGNGRSFRHYQMQRAAELFNISMDWIFGFTDKMDRKQHPESIEGLLSRAMVLLKTQKEPSSNGSNKKLKKY